MTAPQAVVCLVQQMQAACIAVTSVSPLKAEGRAEDLFHFRAVVGYLRARAAKRSAEEGIDFDFDSLLARLVTAKGEIRWSEFTGLPWTLAEQDLLLHVGEFVWLHDNVFLFGRLEGVLPGVALVSPRPHPLLPEDPVAAFRARTEGALPFALDLVKADAGALSSTLQDARRCS